MGEMADDFLGDIVDPPNQFFEEDEEDDFDGYEEFEDDDEEDDEDDDYVWTGNEDEHYGEHCDDDED